MKFSGILVIIQMATKTIVPPRWVLNRIVYAGGGF